MTIVRALLILSFAIVTWCFSETSASAATCPNARIVASEAGTTYVARIFDREAYTGAVDVTLYTATESYAAHLPTVSVATPDGKGYRSDVVRFERPGTEPFEAAVFTFPAADSKDGCLDRFIIDPKVTDPLVTPAPDALDQSVSRVPLIKVIASTGVQTCEHRYGDAQIDGMPAQVQYPPIARQTGATGIVKIRIDLNVDGSVAGASIFHSSGYFVLDQAALEAAKETRYHPAIFHCEPIAGSYIFTVQFSGR